MFYFFTVHRLYLNPVVFCVSALICLEICSGFSSAFFWAHWLFRSVPYNFHSCSQAHVLAHTHTIVWEFHTYKQTIFIKSNPPHSLLFNSFPIPSHFSLQNQLLFLFSPLNLLTSARCTWGRPWSLGSFSRIASLKKTGPAFPSAISCDNSSESPITIHEGIWLAWPCAPLVYLFIFLLIFTLTEHLLNVISISLHLFTCF